MTVATATRRLALALFLLAVLATIVVLLLRDEEPAASGPETDASTTVPAPGHQPAAADLEASSTSNKTANRDAATERELASATCSVQFTLDTAPAAGAEVLLLPWTDRVEARAYSMEGLSTNLIRREATRLTADQEGRIAIPIRLAPVFMAVRAPGSAPYGQLLATLPLEFDIDLSPEEVLRGRVIADTEMPAISARVTARRAFQAEASFHEVRAQDPQRIAGMFFESQVEVSVDGSFEVGGLPAGRVWVMAHSEGTASNQHVEWSLPMDDEILLLLSDVHTLAGRVVRERDGEPIEGVRLSSFYWERGVSIVEMTVTQTDEEGRFVLEGVPDGPAGGGVRLVREGFASQLVHLPDRMTEADRQNLLFHLVDACSATGFAVSSFDGEPIGDMYVQVHDGETSELTNWTKTDERGEFTLDFLAPGKTYELVGSAKGYYIQRLPAQKLCGEELIELEMDPVASLVGTVITEALPVPKARARIVLEDASGNRFENEFADVDAETGEFRFPHLEAGVYVLDVAAEGYAPARIEQVAVEDGDEPNRVEVRLNRGATLRGRVFSSSTGQQVVGASVTLGDVDSYGSTAGRLPTAPLTSTDGEGQYLLEHVPVDVPFRLLAEHPDYSTFTREFVVERGQLTATCDIELIRSASMSVSIRDEQGRRFSQFNVAVWTSNGEIRNVTTSRAVQLFDNLVPGPAFVAANLGGRVRADIGQQQFNRTVELAAGKHTQVEFTLEGGARLHGRITGTALKTRQLKLLLSVSSKDQPNRPDFITTVAADSNYAFAGLPAGPRLVLLRADAKDAGINVSKPVELVAGEDLELDLHVQLTGVEGMVRSSEGRKLSGALIWAGPWEEGLFIEGRRSDYHSLSTNSDELGTYNLFGMEPGTYVYTVELPGYGLEQGLFEIPEEETVVQQDLTLAPEARLEVLPSDRTGAPVTDVDCFLRRSDEYSIIPNNPLDEYLPDRLVFGGAATGIYTVHVEADGFFPSDTEVACRAGETTTASVTLRRPGSIQLRIVSPEGMTLPDFPLQIIDTETGTDVAAWIEQRLVTSSTSATATDDVGELTLENLPEGRFQIESQNLSATVTVVADTLTGPKVLVQQF